jgi:N-acetylmuramoyl-L-alanine amidase
MKAMRSLLTSPKAGPLGALILLVTLFAADAFALKPTAAQAVPSTVYLEATTGFGQGYTIKVQGLRQNNAVLVDLGSFARAMRLSQKVEGGQIQIEETFSRPGTSCILTSGSNFALVLSRDRQSERRILQIKSSPEVWQSRMYLPVDQLCRLFTLWLDREVVYDPSENRIKAFLWGLKSGPSYRSLGMVTQDIRESTRIEEVPAERGGAAVIEDVEVETRANGVVIRFAASGSKTASSFLKPDENGSAYLTLEKAGGSIERLTKRYNEGIVRSITPMQLQTGALQFVISLNTDAFVLKSADVQYDVKNNDYVLYVMSNIDVEAIRRAEKEKLIQQQLSKDVNKWQLDAIVVDAGHGGRDPGAIGQRGTREKDVVLNIVNDLGMFIKQKWPELRVIYTRKDDRFIPLHERGRVANRYGGKLFVSVHCNSTPKTHVRGAEVYILGTHKTQDALEVAMFENSVITKEENYRERYKGFSDEYMIMSSMAQSAFAKQSTELARYVLRKIERKESTNGFGVRQAGFMVLWTPSMPSVLVETGYLSNPDEERVLRDREEQTKIAYGIFQGLQQYKATYENRMMAIGRSQ